MSKFIIEFDQTSGCKNCPCCQFKEGFEILGDTGFYCTNKIPSKLILGTPNKNKDSIHKPFWCPLKEFKEQPKDLQTKTIPSTIPVSCRNTEKILTRMAINPVMLVAHTGILDAESVIKDQIARDIAMHPTFKENIKWSEIEIHPDLNPTRVIQGEVEIVVSNG